MEPTLAILVADARAAWPTVQLATDLFVAYLTDRIAEGAGDAGLGGVRGSDLFLACACLHGDPNALAAFELHYLTVIDRALPRLGMGADVVSEVKQRLRHVLLVADNGPPRIAKFGDRGDLRRWVRVLAVREALALARKARRHVTAGEDRLVDLVAASGSPELEYFKRVYRREVEVALGQAVRTLSDRERSLIGQHFLDGLDIIEIGRLYRVHRVTAGRWLAGARAALLAATRAHLVERLDVSLTELESIVRLVLSQLDLNLRPLLRPRRS